MIEKRCTTAILLCTTIVFSFRVGQVDSRPSFAFDAGSDEKEFYSQSEEEYQPQESFENHSYEEGEYVSDNPYFASDQRESETTKTPTVNPTNTTTMERMDYLLSQLLSTNNSQDYNKYLTQIYILRKNEDTFNQYQSTEFDKYLMAYTTVLKLDTVMQTIKVEISRLLGNECQDHMPWFKNMPVLLFPHENYYSTKFSDLNSGSDLSDPKTICNSIKHLLDTHLVEFETLVIDNKKFREESEVYQNLTYNISNQYSKLLSNTLGTYGEKSYLQNNNQQSHDLLISNNPATEKLPQNTASSTKKPIVITDVIITVEENEAQPKKAGKTVVQSVIEITGDTSEAHSTTESESTAITETEAETTAITETEAEKITNPETEAEITAITKTEAETTSITATTSKTPTMPESEAETTTTTESDVAPSITITSEIASDTSTTITAAKPEHTGTKIPSESPTVTTQTERTSKSVTSTKNDSFLQNEHSIHTTTMENISSNDFSESLLIQNTTKVLGDTASEILLDSPHNTDKILQLALQLDNISNTNNSSQIHIYNILINETIKCGLNNNSTIFKIASHIKNSRLNQETINELKHEFPQIVQSVVWGDGVKIKVEVDKKTFKLYANKNNQLKTQKSVGNLNWYSNLTGDTWKFFPLKDGDSFALFNIETESALTVTVPEFGKQPKISLENVIHRDLSMLPSSFRWKLSLVCDPEVVRKIMHEKYVMVKALGEAGAGIVEDNKIHQKEEPVMTMTTNKLCPEDAWLVTLDNQWKTDVSLEVNYKGTVYLGQVGHSAKLKIK